MPSFDYGENRPPFQNKLNICARKCPFFFKIVDMPTLKKQTLSLREIQNDDVYPLTMGVAGPGFSDMFFFLLKNVHMVRPKIGTPFSTY